MTNLSFVIENDVVAIDNESICDSIDILFCYHFIFVFFSVLPIKKFIHALSLRAAPALPQREIAHRINHIYMFEIVRQRLQ